MFDKFIPNEYERLENAPRYPELIGTSAAFGCSITFGIGVEIGEDWPGLLGLYNAGQPGSSNDRIARRVSEYVSEYSPERIYVMWTYPGRREWLSEDGTYMRFNSTSKHHTGTDWHNSFVMLSNERADKYNYYKNKKFVEALCHSNGIELCQCDINLVDADLYERGTDGHHPGKKWHEEVANRIKYGL